MIDFKNELNEEQFAAVQTIEGPVLVLAGAGTGKTRVITYRMAYLMQQASVDPGRILAVTFTNKAAKEMKDRLYGLVGPDANMVWMGTFHSMALRMLRRDGHHAGLGGGFGVIDQDDRMSLVRSIVRDLNIDPKKYTPKLYMYNISNFKNSIGYVHDERPTEYLYRFQDVYEEYQKALKSSNLIDFDDMLPLIIRVLKNEQSISDYYTDLFRYILVDEYQDTNYIQFMFLSLLAGNTDGNICVVGDDDQSIYGWRGAEIRNILEFDGNFKGVKTVKLVENYRSKSEILGIANKLIKNNNMRLGKDLIAVTGEGGLVEPKSLIDEVDEADFVAKNVKKYMDEGLSPKEISVLYRTNAQSRNFEVTFNNKGIPYKVIGSIGFYQRREVKDILSYLRFFDNQYDLESFRRSIKNPRRGFGDTGIERVVGLAQAENINIYDALRMSMSASKGAQLRALQGYSAVIEGISKHSKISDMVNYVVEATEYKDFIKRSEDAHEAEKKIFNVDELYNAAAAFEQSNPEATLQDFLASATLITSQDQEATDSVSLMTVHAAKGLEFETVFLTGMEEGLFPLHGSIDEPEELEEERRLCYVGVTRAKKNLYITHADRRMMYGQRKPGRPSLFLEEMNTLPKRARREMPAGFNTVRKGGCAPVKTGGDKLAGKKVTHEKFGEGKIIGTSGKGAQAKADVFFKKAGFKKIMLSFLKVED